MVFAHLHVHSEFSTLDGLSRIDELFARVAAMGQTHVAITDHGTLGAHWRAQKAADEHGVTFIPGLEAYVAIGSRFERERLNIADFDGGEGGRSKQSVYYHLTLLAKNETGWRNLIAIQNESAKHVAGRGKLIDWEFLAEHADGLIALTGCLGGPVLKHLAAGDEAGAIRNLERLQSIFGTRVGVEVMDHGIAEETAVLPRLAEIAAERGIPLIATNDSHFSAEHDHSAHNAWLQVGSKATIAAPKFQFEGHGYWLRTEDEMRQVREEPWWQQAVTNAGALASIVTERVVPRPLRRLPAAPVPEGYGSGADYLQALIADGIQARYGVDASAAVAERVRTEWATIHGMGFVDYFLIVHELVNWSRGAGIAVGPGRGSGPGSICLYAIGVTDVDPLEHELLFERFLEPGRAELPDVDLDFDSRRRAEVIQHLRDLYGNDSVALIGNVMQVQSKQAIKDAARVLEEPAVGNKLASLVPDGLSMAELQVTRNDATAPFHDAVGTSTQARSVAELATEFDKVTRSMGIHASGVVVAPEPLTGLIPMRRDADSGGWVAEWDMSAIEEFGLVKLDVLGLRNLAMAEVTMESVPVNGLADIPHPDSALERNAAAWRMLRDGRTAGVFQLDSSGMTNLVTDIRPETWADLSAAVALYRPGPMSAGMHDQYARRKNGIEDIAYAQFSSDPDEIAAIDSVLGETYGVWVYQEQLMKLGRVVAGFDDTWRSKLRKAVSKKKADMMAEVGKKFLEGAVVEHRDEAGEVFSIAFDLSTAQKLWDAMLGSASYLFNRSHSAAYGLLAFQTAYLKANWPAEYGAATLAVTSNDDKRRMAIRALREEGLEVAAPDVNLSMATTTARDGVVRFGLAEIKGVGDGDAAAILAEREQFGPFLTMEDLAQRVSVDGKAISSRVLQALIVAGALDDFGPRKAMFRRSYAPVLVTHMAPGDEFSPLERAARQRSALLVSTGEHPATSVREQLDAAAMSTPGFDSTSQRIGDLASRDLSDGTRVVATGLLVAYSEKAYKSGRLASIEIEDEHGGMRGTMWEKARAMAVSADAIPPVGWPVIVSGFVRSHVHESLDSGEVEVSSELMVTTMQRVEV